MQEDLLTTLHETTTELLQTIDSFTQEQYNKVPYEGSWTGAQLSEHLLLAESGLPPVLLGTAEPIKQQSGEKAELIKKIFLDFSHKMQSPDFIVPTGKRTDKADLYNAIKNNRAEIERLAGTINLEQTFTDFSLPNLGSLTGIEWITFIVCHAKRHIHQLKNIYASVA